MSSLLLQRKLGPLFLTQFGGAFNDNIYKNAFAVLLVYGLAQKHNYDSALLVNFTHAIFILPYLLFASHAGTLGDIHDKARLIQYTKVAEIGIVLSAILAFHLQNIPLFIFIVFLLSVQSAFFAPLKYSIIPYHLPNRILDANALMNTGTFIAIIGGTLLGTYLVTIQSGLLIISGILLITSIGGYLISRLIPAAPPALAAKTKIIFHYEPFSAAFRLVRTMLFSRPGLRAPLLGVSWFWFAGSSLITQIPILTGTYLRVEGLAISLFMIMFAVGIGAGALACVLLLKGKITSRYAWSSSILMGVLFLDAGFAARSVSQTLSFPDYIPLMNFLHNWHAIRLCIDFFLLSAAGGFYVVPIFSLLQHRAQAVERARIIAANNILNALFMVLSALLIILAYTLGAQVFFIYILLGIACLLVAFIWLRFANQEATP